MSGYSTRQAAQKLGIGFSTLRKYVDLGLIPVPPITYVGGVKVRLWTDQDIERLRDLLPKLPDGRKTRHRKEQKEQKAEKQTKSKKK